MGDSPEKVSESTSLMQNCDEEKFIKMSSELAKCEKSSPKKCANVKASSYTIPHPIVNGTSTSHSSLNNLLETQSNASGMYC